MASDASSPVLVYLHGFNSSSRSQKVSELRTILPAIAPDIELVAPDFGFDPEQAVALACETILSAGNRPVGVIGSSMGGFYASVVSARLSVPAVLVNPAAWPYQLLRSHLGPQHNPYTGEEYELTPDHMATLEAMEPGDSVDPEKLFILVQTRDETLDCREVLAKHPRARTWIQPGGDHRFQNFSRVVPAILAFLFSRSFR